MIVRRNLQTTWSLVSTHEKVTGKRGVPGLQWLDLPCGRWVFVVTEDEEPGAKECRRPDWSLCEGWKEL